jgi:hypothetical protein
MGMQKKIVVWDPHGSLLRGQVVQDGDNARRAELMRGLVTLPYEPSLRELGGVGGFADRAFGDGELFDRMQPRVGCGLIVAASQDSTRLQWVARLSLWGERPLGRMQLAGLPSVLGPVACMPVPLEGPVELEQRLGPPDEWGGWTVRGLAALACPTAGYLSVGLQATAQHLRVLWFAASVERGS